MPATVIRDVNAEFGIPVAGTLSRVLYHDDQLRVVGFAFDTGQELTEHSSAVPVVIQVVRGRLELLLDGEKAEAGPGCWIYLPARMPHAVRAAEPTIMLLTMVPATGPATPTQQQD